MTRAPLSSDAMLRLGEAIESSDLRSAITVIAQASGVMIPPIDDDDGEPYEIVKGRRRRRKNIPHLDPSGYPAVASLTTDQLAALVRACWARVHGEAVRSTGYLAAYRKLVERGLARQEHRYVAGRPVDWYVATELGATVVLKALMRGVRRVTTAVYDMRG